MPGGWRTEKPAYKQDGGAKLYKVCDLNKRWEL